MNKIYKYTKKIFSNKKATLALLGSCLMFCCISIFADIPTSTLQEAIEKVVKQQANDSPQIFTDSQSGVFHIDDYKKLSKSIIPLTTNWEFYPSKFIEPGENSIENKKLVSIPSNWKSYTLGEPFDSSFGSGSYRLNITGLKPLTEYAFSIYDLVGTAFRLIINGIVITTVGFPSENYTETIADQQMKFVTFDSDQGGNAELIFHVSNNFYDSGGFWNSIQLSEAHYSEKVYNREQNTTFLFLGALFTVFLYQLFLFFFRKDKESIYLALFVLTIGLRILVSPFSIPKLYIPDISYSLLLKLEYTAIFLAPVFFALHIYKLIPNLFPKFMLFTISIIGSLIAAIVYITPIGIGRLFLLPSQIFMILSSLCFVFSLVIQYIKTRSSITRLVLIGLFVIFIGAIHDIFTTAFLPMIFPEISFIPYTFIIFVFFQIAITARQREQTQTAIANLSETLSETNKAYYRFVPKEFLSLLSKKNITDVHLGEWISRDMTLLCADIRNFTTISESLSGKAVFDLLNRYLMRVAPIIRNNEGFIEKYLGDGIIALFPNDGKKAFNCALQMQKEISKLRTELEQENLPKIEIGIGLNFGRIVLGTVGGKDRMNEITISKAIETVMILESLTKVYKKPIIASKVVISKWLSQNDFPLTHLDSQLAAERGIKEPIFSIEYIEENL